MITTLLLAASLLLAQDSPTTNAQPPEKEKAPAPRASLVLAHLAPGAPTVSVWINGAEAVKSLPYGATATASVSTEMPAKIELRTGGKTVYSMTSRLTKGFFTVPFFGGEDEIYGESMEAKPMAGKAVIQFFHAAEADPVKILIDGTAVASIGALPYGSFHKEAVVPGKHLIAIHIGDKPIATKELDLKADTFTSFFAVSNQGQIELRSVSHIPATP